MSHQGTKTTWAMTFPRINCRTTTATVLTATATVTLPLRACLCFLLSHLLSQVHQRQKQLSDFVEPKKCWRAKRGSDCTRRGSRKTVSCHALRVVEPVYHQALLLCGRWRSRRSSARRGGPLEVHCVISQDSLLYPFLMASDSCHDQASAWQLGGGAETGKSSSVAGVHVLSCFLCCDGHRVHSTRCVCV